ncbi:MAG TPA: GntR family transcriptional regulator [Candidatus Dormibacteraeota bacterium]|nr:GntR family transcriptional regulator [Candidatus Dormibacteraeota bacterium]
MVIDSDQDHLFLQVIDEIKRKIESGKYKEKEILPSEFQLSKELDVSRDVLSEALRILEEDNVLVRRHGIGLFVNPQPMMSSGIEELSSVTAMIEQSGKLAGTQYLSTDVIVPTEDERLKFKSNEFDKLVKVERIRTADGEPVVFCIDKIPEILMPLEHLYQEESMFKLMKDYAEKTISYAHAQIEPISYHERIYNILDCRPEQSLLLVKQMHYTAEDEPIMFSSNYFRADMFSFNVLRKISQ